MLVPEGDGRWVEYAGGYTDMLAQRGADLAGTKAVRQTQAAAPSSEPRRASAPCQDRQAPPELQREARAGNAPRADRRAAGRACAGCRIGWAIPTLYARDRQAFAQASEALSATQAELAAAEERWLELEMLREEIEGP